MAGFVWIGALAAFGLVSALWMVYGLCCGRAEGTLVILSRGGPGLIRRCLWLREMGVLSCRMVLVEPELEEMDEDWLRSRGVEIWRTSRLREANDLGERIYGAGTGDSSGRHQRGGVSEL